MDAAVASLIICLEKVPSKEETLARMGTPSPPHRPSVAQDIMTTLQEHGVTVQVHQSSLVDYMYYANVPRERVAVVVQLYPHTVEETMMPMWG